MSAYAKKIGEIYYRSWGHLGGITDEDASTWLRFAVPTMRASKTQAAYTQLAYTRQIARSMDLAPTAKLDIASVVADGLPDRYMSPVIDARTSLAQGSFFDDAMDKAARLVRELARTDVADTSQQAAVAAMDDTPGVVAYRRVPSDVACDFCLLIAGQTYRTDELAPAHNNCTCGVAPVSDEDDPTLERQRALSKDLYADQQRVDDAQAETDRLGSDGPIAVQEPPPEPEPAPESADLTPADMTSEPWQAWSGDLTSDELGAVKRYQSSSAINDDLRSDSPLTAEQNAYVDNLDSAIAKGSLPRDATVYRGAQNAEQWLGTPVDESAVGARFSDSGFVSTTGSEHLAVGYSGVPVHEGGSGAVIEYRLPKGYASASLPVVSGRGSTAFSEQELTLPRGQVMRVIGYERQGDKGYLGKQTVDKLIVAPE